MCALLRENYDGTVASESTERQNKKKQRVGKVLKRELSLAVNAAEQEMISCQRKNRNKIVEKEIEESTVSITNNVKPSARG